MIKNVYCWNVNCLVLQINIYLEISLVKKFRKTIKHSRQCVNIKHDFFLFCNDLYPLCISLFNNRVFYPKFCFVKFQNLMNDQLHTNTSGNTLSLKIFQMSFTDFKRTVILTEDAQIKVYSLKNCFYFNWKCFLLF